MSVVPRKDGAKIGLDGELTFGKHKGKKLRAVLKEAPAYVVWAIANISWFDISDDARKFGQRELNKAEQRRINRMEAWCWGFRGHIPEWDNGGYERDGGFGDS